MAKGKAKKSLKFIVLLVLIAGAIVCGFFTAKHITRNDTFEIIGERTVTIQVGQVYEDQGAKAISFGKDVSSKITAESNVNNMEEGSYYIKYTVDDIRYKNIERYRIVIVVAASEGEVTDENN